MHVRNATPADAPAVQAIYAHHVRHGVGTFEEEPPTVEEITRRMGIGHWIVAHEDERLLGYAYHAPYRPRSAYRFTVEDSVYVHPDALGRGVGGRLLPALIEHARATGLRRMVAAIGSSDNHASLALHARHGFTRSGVLRGVGTKFGRTLDVVLMQRDL